MSGLWQECSNSGVTSLSAEMCRRPTTARRVHTVQAAQDDEDDDKERILLIWRTAHRRLVWPVASTSAGPPTDSEVCIRHRSTNPMCFLSTSAKRWHPNHWKRLTGPWQHLVIPRSDQQERFQRNVAQEKGQEQKLNFYMTHTAAHMPILGQDMCESLGLVNRINQIEVHTLRRREPVCWVQRCINRNWRVCDRISHGNGWHATHNRAIAAIPTCLVGEVEEDHWEAIAAGHHRQICRLGSNLVVVGKRNGSLWVCLDPKSWTLQSRRRHTASQHLLMSRPSSVKQQPSQCWTWRVLSGTCACLSRPFTCAYSHPVGEEEIPTHAFWHMLCKRSTTAVW